ncbi:hypothetical protein AA23498_1782 [Acetobacter nitrogenifigens DSM 23921 = NBRC 105050]|uniref:Uncharacterized protein n=1 Tax=Acetobacter nitrogenifigens DSM 23921 = NBRC 105050 TaxID=1120919 RepID=A0A511X9J5_9PROT|nr:hypothetical protein AA23498_1782 [Acetobacter nitrogenifigens DSM 23921 = NBRC 105050]GEN59620.1 hypothetical protein ANI02nite_15040 [Acetobacter nitrogenifigens DSM 23921 = NBRC 105050]
MRDPFVRIEPLGKAGAGAEPERIAGSKHNDCPPTFGQNGCDGEWNRPRASALPRIYQREVTGATENHRGPVKFGMARSG